MTKKNISDVINQELKEYNAYINGNVYCYVLRNEKGEEVDSCCGYIDIDNIKQDLPKEYKNEDMEEYYSMF